MIMSQDLFGRATLPDGTRNNRIGTKNNKPEETPTTNEQISESHRENSGGSALQIARQPTNLIQD